MEPICNNCLSTLRSDSCGVWSLTTWLPHLRRSMSWELQQARDLEGPLQEHARFAFQWVAAPPCARGFLADRIGFLQERGVSAMSTARSSFAKGGRQWTRSMIPQCLTYLMSTLCCRKSKLTAFRRALVFGHQCVRQQLGTQNESNFIFRACTT